MHEKDEITPKLLAMTKIELVKHFSKRHNALFDKHIELKQELSRLKKKLLIMQNKHL